MGNAPFFPPPRSFVVLSLLPPPPFSPPHFGKTFLRQNGAWGVWFRCPPGPLVLHSCLKVFCITPHPFQNADFTVSSIHYVTALSRFILPHFRLVLFSVDGILCLPGWAPSESRCVLTKSSFLFMHVLSFSVSRRALPFLIPPPRFGPSAGGGAGKTRDQPFRRRVFPVPFRISAVIKQFTGSCGGFCRINPFDPDSVFAPVAPPPLAP